MSVIHVFLDADPSQAGVIPPVTVDGLRATAVTHFAKTLTPANTEVSQALPAGTKSLTFRARTSVDIRYAFTTGKVAGPTEPYFNLRAGEVFNETGLNLTGATLYLASATAGTVVEIEAWS